MSASAFQALPRGGLSRVSARVPRAVCGLRMQADVEASEEVSDESDSPKMSRAQRRLQGKYSKKNTDGSMKATQQVGTAFLPAKREAAQLENSI
jgi:exo-beta-1,3-glucanase (GH17 family)